MREFSLSGKIIITLLLQLLLLLLLYIKFIYKTESCDEDSIFLELPIEDIGIYPTLKLHFTKHYLTRVNV
jgi:hypothetical protein